MQKDFQRSPLKSNVFLINYPEYNVRQIFTLILR